MSPARILVVDGRAAASAPERHGRWAATHLERLHRVELRGEEATAGRRLMDLFEHLHRRGRDYDAIFFFGATDPTTVEGLPLVPERSVLVPDLVGRPATSVPAVIFYLPRAIGFWTEAERDEIHRAFANEHVPHEILERRDPSEAGFGSALEALVLVAASHG